MALSSEQIPEALDALRSFLRGEKADGRERLDLSRDSLERLRALPERLRQRPSAPPPTPRLAETPPHQESTPEPEKAREARPGGLHPPGTTKAEKIRWLAEQAEQCQECRGLGTLRDVMVFSVGNPDADLMFVGEAPGFEEERQREPFVGPAGQKLTAIIKAMGLRRPEDIYISNIVKFRPADGDPRFQGQRNRKPTPVEMAAAVKYVLAEIEVVRPRAIVALGATAAEGLLGISGSIARMRNQFHDLRGIPVMVTYHPSYLLRQESNSPDGGKADKRKVWEDMLMVMERLGLPISEKQRGYFA
ncbi:MAG: uracil-DNA glycosylase [Verrucomicrobiae bacterium]|nr:uracil-DNA glycosylase [Verrucomicrobiae bacterium]